jgi:hypothetical protein
VFFVFVLFCLCVFVFFVGCVCVCVCVCMWVCVGWWCVCVCVCVFWSLHVNTQEFNLNILFRILKKSTFRNGMSLHFVQTSSENCRVCTAAILVLAGIPTTFLSVQSQYKFQPPTRKYLYVFLSNRIRTEFAVLLYHFTFDNEISVKTFYEDFFFFHNSEPKLGVLLCSSICHIVHINTEKLNCLQLLALQCKQGVRKSAN